MNRLNIFSWSINVKIFLIFLGAFIMLNLINTPLSIQSFTNVNRQVFRQVVTETALRQQTAIDRDFELAFDIFDEFQASLLQNLSFTFTNTSETTVNLANDIMTESLLDEASLLYKQVWLVNADGQVISNLINLGNTRYSVDLETDLFPDASTSPAYNAGVLLAQNFDLNRNIDLVIEEVNGELSIQLVANVFDIQDNLVGMLVVELNNDSVILNNIQSTEANKDIYTFVTSPINSKSVFINNEANIALVNLDTQATRSSTRIQEAQFYRSGNRSVIGYYTPLFETYRRDILLVVELDEAVALQGVSTAILDTTGPTFILEIIILFIAIFIVNRLFVNPINVITNRVRALNAGDFQSATPISTGDDEIGNLAESVIELQQQLHILTTDMNAGIEARTRDLQVTQEIGRVATSENDVNKLMTEVVDLIIDRFDSIYHAQIFLIEGNNAVLKSSTGEIGQQLLARGHRLGVGSLSVIGQVTQQNQTIIARDTASSEVHRRNEFLQDTRAELAIPMRLGTRVIGALDVQSTQRDVFDEDLVTILETLTSQIAIAIENSRLYEASRRRLTELDNTARQRTQHNWEDFMYTQRTDQLTTRAGAPVLNDFSELRQQAAASQKITVGELTNRDTIPIAIPIVIREQVLGVVEWEIQEAEFNQNRVLLAEELASRLAVSLDNARLVQTGRQTAENERIINTISAKISGQTDIAQILQTAIQEVGQALRAPQVNINIQRSGTNGNDHHDNGHQPDTDNS